MSIILPTWIERLLGINAGNGEGTACSLEFVWRWPPWITFLFVLFAAAFVVAIYLREGGHASRRRRILLATLRLSLIGLVLLMIAQTTLSLQKIGLPNVAVLLDDSLSMTTVDHYAERSRRAAVDRIKDARLENTELSRWNLARATLLESKNAWMRRLADDYNPRFYLLSGARPIHQQDMTGIAKEIRATLPSGQSTRLGDGVRAALDDLRGTSPAGVVLLTDGINTEGATLNDAAEYAKRRGVPLFFIGFGSEEPMRDVKLSDVLVDDVVFVDDVVNFECKVSASGFEGKNVAVTLREKNKQEVLAKTEITLGRDGLSQQVRIPYRPSKVGQFDFVVEVEPQKGEVQIENNRQTRTVQVRKEKIRVLLVQGSPSFEYRYLRNMLERDETIALRTVLQEADREHAEQDASALRTFPLRRDELFAYDVVIVGDANPKMLGEASLRNLADFVDQPAKGGALVLIAGASYMPAAYRDTPIGRMLPFDATGVKSPDSSRTLKEGFVVRPTDLGLASPPMQLGDGPDETLAIWRGLAPLYWLMELPELKPGVRVLAEHPTRVGADGRRLPVFCLQYIGAGKVLFHATDETWRWRYRTGDAYFARYWVQMIRYLCRAKLTDAGRSVALSTDRREYAQGESVRLRARFSDERLAPAADDGVAVVVELSGRQTHRVVLRRTSAARGVFETQLERPAPGDYHAWIVRPTLKDQTPAVDFVVAPPVGEFAKICMDAAEMRRAAEETGGCFYTFDSADRLHEDLPRGRQVPIESLPPMPLWNRWPVLALFLGLLIAEWILRKRGGMV